MATLISVSWTYKYFMGSLLSIPLHRLERISFSATPGNKCCHGNTFFLFIGLVNIFMGSLLSIQLHRLELISGKGMESKEPIVAMATLFYVSWA